MIVYHAKKHEFLDDVDSNKIEELIHSGFRKLHHRSVGASELASWKNSLGFMQRILTDPDIPADSGIGVEFGIPLSAKRIDFILTGRSEAEQQTAIIIELKQWSAMEPTDKDAIVRTRLGGAEVETPHPSYQAWSYAALLEDYNETVRERKIALRPCAYLHNCPSGEVVHAEFYRSHIERAPAFLQSDAAKLRAFIKKHVRYGDSGQVLFQIRDGKLSPSKNLADSLASLLQGNREFLMIDDQKLVYETGLQLAEVAASGQKQVLLVEGGPGTGKSVVAVNLLVELTKRKQLVQYVTKNAAPRRVYESKLTGAFKKSQISNLFVGSGSFIGAAPNIFGALIVDEAHRLNEKSGMFMNLGENQVKELISAAGVSVFFLDEDQRVTLKDIGTVAEITKHAKDAGATVTRLKLESQFRCNGSDGYLAWIDNLLGIRDTANTSLEGVNYEFVVCDSAAELREKVLAKNKGKNRSRMVAGYCWDWKSKKDKKQHDIVLPGFSARWNLDSDGMLWIVKPETVNEVGCIHTCQGLELEYIGVILGEDWVVRDGVIVTDPAKRSSQDSSIKGYKALAARNPVEAKVRTAQIIKNTYRTLMTRGQRGCFVYSVDPETNAYLKQAIGRGSESPSTVPEKYPSLALRILSHGEVQPFINAVPLYDIQVAAGGFSAPQENTAVDWVELPDGITPKPGLFVSRVVGESMNRRIPNGSWCLFRRVTAGSRDGRVVLAELLDRQDPDGGGRYTVKIYKSAKRLTEDAWEHSTVLLKPDSTNDGYSELRFTSNPDEALRVIAEFVAVL
jgi:uncharacterized protein